MYIYITLFFFYYYWNYLWFLRSLFDHWLFHYFSFVLLFFLVCTSFSVLSLSFLFIVKLYCYSNVCPFYSFSSVSFFEKYISLTFKSQFTIFFVIWQHISYVSVLILFFIFLCVSTLSLISSITYFYMLSWFISLIPLSISHLILCLLHSCEISTLYSMVSYHMCWQSFGIWCHFVKCSLHTAHFLWFFGHVAFRFVYHLSKVIVFLTSIICFSGVHSPSPLTFLMTVSSIFL